MATHSNILAWRIPWTEEPGGLQSTGSQKVDRTERLHFHFHFQWQSLLALWSFPGGASGKEPACQCRRPERCGVNPWVRKIPWRRAWQPSPVLLPGESHGQRSLAGYSPWGLKESESTKGTQHTSHAHRDLALLTSRTGRK